MTTELRKAAILLTSLPEDQAAILLAKLNPKQVEAVTIQIAKLGRLTADEQEGVLRDACLHDGKRCDILVFSILEDEMRHQRQREQYPYMGFWERAP